MVKWCAIAFVVACQGQGATPAGGSAARSAIVVSDGAVVRDAQPVGSDEPDVDVGGIPAWQAVVDRTQYLARRGQHGVVVGLIGTVIGSVIGSVIVAASDAGVVASPYVWLIDDSEGNGALAIRVALGANASAVKDGDRVALGGAWALDDARRWYWNVDAVTPLPAAAPSDAKDPPAAPGHAIANGDLPQGARPISLAKENDAVYFQLVGPPPAIVGDGWPVADENGNPVYALLNLPGERPSYGAQDLRAPDERWQLRRGQTYALRIGHIHKHGPDKPATINARTAPVRVK